MRHVSRNGATMAAALALAITLGAGTTARGEGTRKPGDGSTTKTVTALYPVEVSFGDRDGDAITSDGLGPYRDGQKGVSASMQVTTTTTGGTVTSQTGKLVVSIGTYRGKLARSININYRTPVGTSCMPVPGVPTGAATAYYLQVLSGVPIMPLETRAGGGGFFANTPTDPSGVFRFRDPNLANYPDNCSSTYVITRDTKTTWTVTTDFDPTVTYHDSKGNPVSNLGDTSQFENSSGLPFYGNYKMPFRMTISCLSATNCSPVGG